MKDPVRTIGPHRRSDRGTGRFSVFFFYNSRWGCMASLLVSLALTALLLFLLGWI